MCIDLHPYEFEFALVEWSAFFLVWKLFDWNKWWLWIAEGDLKWLNSIIIILCNVEGNEFRSKIELNERCELMMNRHLRHQTPQSSLIESIIIDFIWNLFFLIKCFTHWLINLTWTLFGDQWSLAYLQSTVATQFHYANKLSIIISPYN